MDPELLHQAPLYAILAAVGFFLLAFILLYPVWRFLNREEEVSRYWTPEMLANRAQPGPQGGDGAAMESEPVPPDARSS